MQGNFKEILEITDSDAICVRMDGTVLRCGDETLFPSNSFWEKGFGREMYVTNSVEDTSGSMVRFDLHRHKFVFFRKARGQDVTWGGNPDEPKDLDNPYHPRNSFEAYTQSAKLESREWSKQDLIMLNWLKDRVGIIITKENFEILEGNLEQTKDARAGDRDFFASMSHELRTPFHGVMGCVKVIEDNLKEAVEMTRVAQRSGQSMISVLNDILVSAKNAHAVNVGTSVVLLESVMNTSVSSMMAFAATNNIFLEKTSHDPSRVRMNSTLVPRVLTNFFNNAIKFTGTNGKISVSGGISHEIKALWGKDDHDCTVYVDGNVTKTMWDLEKGAWAYFNVQDNGCGMESSEMERVFRAYEQGNTSNNQHQGTGLGLFVCASDVSDIGGIISASSTVGVGRIMRFAVPIEIVHRMDRSPEIKIEKTEVVDSTDTILLVDDSRLNLKLSVNTVSKCVPAAKIMTAMSGAEALKV